MLRYCRVLCGLPCRAGADADPDLVQYVLGLLVHPVLGTPAHLYTDLSEFLGPHMTKA